MNDKLTTRAAEIIKEILYITIASVTPDGKPWNSPVYSAYDTDLNFYWFSDKNSQHSTNLHANGEAFLVIYNSTAPEFTGEGVYIEAKVQELTDENEIMEALKLLDARASIKYSDWGFARFSGEAPLRVYCANPLKIWMNDDSKDENGNYLKDTRTEIPLPALKKLI